MNRSSRQKIKKEPSAINNTLQQVDLLDIYRTFHSKATKYTFLSRAHGILSGIDHILGHKTNVNKCKKIDIISNMFSDHNGMKLDISYMKELDKLQTYGE